MESVPRCGRARRRIDSHQHVHQLPGVRRAVLAFLDGLPAGERPRAHLRRAAAHDPPAQRRHRARVAFGWAAELARALRERRVATNDGFSGVLFVAADYRALFRRFLKDVRERTIVICHPAVDEAPGDRIVAARIREYAYLSNEQMPADLAEAGVRVGRFAVNW